MKGVSGPKAFERRSFAVQGVSAKVASRLGCCEEEWPNTYCGKQRRNRKPKLGGWRSKEKETNAYLSSGTMWADNDWLFCDDKEKLTWRVIDIIEKLLILDVEPQLAPFPAPPYLPRTPQPWQLCPGHPFRGPRAPHLPACPGHPAVDLLAPDHPKFRTFFALPTLFSISVRDPVGPVFRRRKAAFLEFQNQVSRLECDVMGSTVGNGPVGLYDWI